MLCSELFGKLFGGVHWYAFVFSSVTTTLYIFLRSLFVRQGRIKIRWMLFCIHPLLYITRSTATPASFYGTRVAYKKRNGKSPEALYSLELYLCEENGICEGKPTTPQSNEFGAP